MADLTANTISLSNPGTSFQYAIMVTQPSGGPAGVMSVTDDSANLRMVVGLGEMLLVGEGGPARIQIVDPTQGTTRPIIEIADQLRFSNGTDAPDVNLYRYSGTLKTDGQFRANDGVKTIEIAGAGRTKAADGDFAHTPVDGTCAAVRNTNGGGKRYWSWRSGGNWYSVEGA